MECLERTADLSERESKLADTDQFEVVRTPDIRSPA
jgi:hypothetical protein